MQRIRAGAKRIGLCRFQIIILTICLFLTLLFHLTKHCTVWIDWVTTWIIIPIQTVLRNICALFSFSVSELAILAAATALLAFLVQSLLYVIQQKGYRLRALSTRCITLLCAVFIGTSSFDWLWGSFYYRSSLQEQTGIYAEEVSVPDLYDVTVYFIEHANETAGQISRSDTGDLSMTPQSIAALSVSVYDELESAFPIFRKNRTAPKVVVFSEGLSYIDCTGFYFPYLGESNLNGHSPRIAMPATAAHELAHQMGIASEQEANFSAVLACTQSSYPAFAYSGWQLGMSYLLNALYRADPGQWETAFSMLSETVRQDLSRINTYWAAYDTPLADTADRINNSRQENYGQDLATQSYGAVVDLLVAYFKPQI